MNYNIHSEKIQSSTLRLKKVKDHRSNWCKVRAVGARSQPDIPHICPQSLPDRAREAPTTEAAPVWESHTGNSSRATLSTPWSMRNGGDEPGCKTADTTSHHPQHSKCLEAWGQWQCPEE